MPLARDGIAPHPRTPAVDRDEIDARRPRPGVPALELRGRCEQALLLPPRQGVYRAVPPMSATALYLDDHKQPTTTADEIELAGGHTHIAPHNQIPAHQVQQRGDELAVAPDLSGSPTQPARSARRNAGGHDTDQVA